MCAQLLRGVPHHVTVGTGQPALEVHGVNVVQEICLPPWLGAAAQGTLHKHRPNDPQRLLDGLQVALGRAPPP